MSKAIAGAAEIGGAFAAAGGILLAESTGVGIAAIPFLVHAMWALAIGGIAMEAGALAEALTANRGQNITTRQPAAQRQIVYGPQRVGGNLVYESTTGSTHRQFNKVIVVAGHQLAGIEALYLDGRRVWFDTSSSGSRTYNGYTFGGNANGGTYTGPSGQRYNFGGLVYAEMRDGSQSPGDVISGLTANDGTWSGTSEGTPYLGGCAYFYLKVEGDASTFPSEPEVRITVHGKACWDPRVGAYVPGCSNPALIAADILTDPVYGLGEDWDSVYTGAAGEQLIAAANVCDEDVYSPSAGLTENRYACGLHYDSSTGIADALQQVFDAMGGRLSRIGGQWFIFPAYWQGPSFNFDYTQLTSEMEWKPTRKFRELNNRVRGTFTCPNFPYNIAGNAYDANGFDSDGNAQNNFSFAWQPTSIPQYAVDPQHGYAADEYLNEDSGVSAAFNPTVTYAAGVVVSYNQTVGTYTYATVWKSLVNGNVGNTPAASSSFWQQAAVELVETVSLPAVLSLGQAQRLLKIRLLRNRQQGSGSFEMRLAALGMQPLDVMGFTWPQMGWTEKPLEIAGCSPLRIVAGADGEARSVRNTFQVQETDSSVYEWNGELEEQSIYDVPAQTAAQAYIVAPPTSMAAIISAATAVTAVDGTVTPRAEITWNTPQDGWATGIQTQYRPSGTSAWLNGPTVDVALNSAYITGIVAGQTYDFQIRTVRSNGAVSVWVQVLNVTAGLTVNSQTNFGIGIGSLVGAALSATTAEIESMAFTARIGQLTISFSAGGFITTDGTLGGSGGSIVPQRGYYVYFIDPTLAGGSISPIATTNISDFLGKPGYFLIDSIVTPAYVSSSVSSTGTRYMPTAYQDSGTRTTSTPVAAYDGDLSTSAYVSGSSAITSPPGAPTVVSSSYGDFTVQGFPAVSLATVANLYVLADPFAEGVDASTISITATIGGTSTSLYYGSPTGSVGSTLYGPVAIPIGTLFSACSVRVQCDPANPSSSSRDEVSCEVTEVYIQS